MVLGSGDHTVDGDRGDDTINTGPGDQVDDGSGWDVVDGETTCNADD